MAKVYFVTGSLGAGKTLCSVDMIRRYLLAGKRVATNVNLNLEYLCSAENKHSRVIRIPDAPSITDLRAIGLGSDSSDDKTHGLLVLDELGTWFNTRDFANKGRLAVIKWMIHMRKRRWDVVFIVQDFGMVDKQARGNIAQHLVTCSSSKDFWMFKPFPKFHSAVVRHTASRMVVERWYYRARDVINAYDTEQLFYTDADDSEFVVDADADMGEKERKCKELNGLYCVLPPAYYSKEKRQEIQQRFDSINRFHKRWVQGIAACLVIGLVYAFYPNESSQASISQETGEQSIVSAPGLSEHDLINVPEYSGVYKYRNYSVIRLVNMFGKKSFTITDGVYTYTSTDLESQGYGVRFREGGEILIVDADRNYVRLYL